MPRSLLKIYLLLLATPSAWAEGPRPSGRFCVQTFNVYGTAYASGRAGRVERIGAELARDPCDAVQLQELWRTDDFRSVRDALQPARQAVLYADDLRGDGSLTGLASAFSGHVLGSRSELFRVNNEKGMLDWFRDEIGVQKGLTAFEVRLDRSPETLFLNLHTHPGSQSVRLAQLLQLIDLALLRSPRAALLPLVLTGDLNATPGSLELDLLRDVLLLRDGYVETHGGSYGTACTYCARNPLSWLGEDRIFDFTLFRSSPDVGLSAGESSVNLAGPSPDEPLSDHYGVRTQLDWQVRAPDLLPPEDPLVAERLRLALDAIRRAREILLDDESPAVREATVLADGLEGALSGELPVPLSRLFRMR